MVNGNSMQVMQPIGTGTPVNIFFRRSMVDRKHKHDVHRKPFPTVLEFETVLRRKVVRRTKRHSWLRRKFSAA